MIVPEGLFVKVVLQVTGRNRMIAAAADINGAKMEGFDGQFRQAQKVCINPNSPLCAQGQEADVMAWHDAREIPNYWSYAKNFVLQDKMFEPDASWSLPEHLFMVSAWSAKCLRPDGKVH